MRKNWSKHFSKSIIMVLVVTLLFFQQVYSQEQQNLLVNGDFSKLDMKGARSQYFISQMGGWNCTNKCQVNDCIPMSLYKKNQGLLFNNCTGLVVDLISTEVSNISQNVILEYDYYTLSLNYFYPLVNANRKTFQVYFNQEKIYSFRPTGNTDFQARYFQTRVQAVSGVNNLRLTTKRNVGVDTYGFFVGNIKLTRSKATRSLRSLMNNTIVSNFTQFMASIPGSRVIFMDFMSFFVHLDRLQFYYFHNRNYSQYSTVLLADINIINDLKGLLFRNVLQHISSNTVSGIDSFFYSIDYKYNYTQSIVLQRNQEGRGFVSNCYPFFLYNIPGTIITYLLLMGLFQLVRSRPASRLIRKFSFLGILMLMVFEGNIESLTYYSIGEMTLFFSANFQHRLINVFIVFFQLIVTIFAVGSVLFFKYNYRRLIFYFIEDKRNNYMGILCQIVDNGVICMLFGFTHSILFFRQDLQLLVLLCLESVWMVFKVGIIFNGIYCKKFSQFIMFIAGLVRISFIITFYFFEEAVKMRILINDDIHKWLIIFTLLLWMQELLVSLFSFIISVPKFFSRLLLLEQKRTKPLQPKQQTKSCHDAVQNMQGNDNRHIRTSKDESVIRVSQRYTKATTTLKERVFKPQMVSVIQSRIQRIFNFNKDNIEFK